MKSFVWSETNTHFPLHFCKYVTITLTHFPVPNSSKGSPNICYAVQSTCSVIHQNHERATQDAMVA